MLKLFSSIVTPILLYCCEIWGPYLLGRINSIQMFKSQILRISGEIENLHLKFYKRILGVHAKACMELKLKPTIFLKYTLQLCKDEELISQNEVSNLQTESFESEKVICHYVKHRLRNVFMRYWCEPLQPVESSGKLRILKKVKKHFECEKYLLEISNFKLRQAVTKLRISAHKLTVETSRYNNTPSMIEYVNCVI